MDAGRISVLMCAYNASAYIEQAIQSIVNQTYLNWELLIADDCSKDNTYQIAELFTQNDKRIKLFKQQQNLGYLHNTNFIWSKATGNFITFQDADDWSTPTRFEEQIAALKNGYDICSTSFCRTDLKGNITSKNELSEHISKADFQSFLISQQEIPLFPGTLFFKKKVSNEIGLYHPFFHRKCGEDIDWILKASRTYQFCNVPKIHYYYRENPSGVTQTINLDKIINNDLIKSIHRTFQNDGIDLLAEENQKALLTLEDKLKKPFLADRSKIYYIQVQNNLYHQKNRDALHFLLKAIWNRPFKLKYYRTLLFICRRFYGQS